MERVDLDISWHPIFFSILESRLLAAAGVISKSLAALDILPD
jgi:hypothetical protein